MDFGNILDEWDSIEKNKSKSSKTPNRSGLSLKCNAGETKSKAEQKNNVDSKKINKTDSSSTNSVGVNPMELWLRRYGVSDKDAAAARESEKNKACDKSYLRKMVAEAKIDLHGMTRDEAWEKLDTFITECVRRKLKKVLIIHGKGNHSSDAPVLEGTVRTFIEKDARLGSFGHPDKSLGGKGATWVIIRP